MERLPYRASLSEDQRQADASLSGWTAGDESAIGFFWRQHIKLISDGFDYRTVRYRITGRPIGERELLPVSTIRI